MKQILKFTIFTLILLCSNHIWSQKSNFYVYFEFGDYKNEKTQRVIASIVKKIKYDEDKVCEFRISYNDQSYTLIEAFEEEIITNNEFEKIRKSNNFSELRRSVESLEHGKLMDFDKFDYYMIEKNFDQTYQVYKVKQIIRSLP
ncbi:hypothetical protein [Flavobacterium selenitireducens]|uniref:hypothetical protein n=1 Tax=Flavobacterium selenitireducens TaxID=2722704 RepID=UPI00168C046A|nr:hypothetical protein [Flavobacterium selenitireducens]MBD3584097.1 hypothetical protein [Flavobacterium selenitireducens]